MTKQTVSRPLGKDEALPLGGAGSGNWGHAGRPGKRGGSVPRKTAMSIRSGKDWKARQAAAKRPQTGSHKGSRAKIYQELHAKRGREVLVALDKDGNETFRREGIANSVPILIDDSPYLKDAVLIHNHPAGWDIDKSNPMHNGNSFSLGDVMVAARDDAAEIVAITPTYVHRLVRPDGGWPHVDVVRTAYGVANLKTMNNWNKKLSAGIVSFEQANAAHGHDVMMELARHLHLEYERVEWTE